MPLKTLVKIGNITNLSDARYCAGMGVDMLGFNILEGADNFVEPKSYQDIRGWISGPSIVGEIYGLTPGFNMTTLLQNYVPDFLELGVDDLKNLPSFITLPILLSAEAHSFHTFHKEIALWKNKIAHLLIKQSEDTTSFLDQLSNEFSVLLRIDQHTDIEKLLKNHSIQGIALNGSKEVRPGLKDYDHLANVLEQLEVE